MSKKNISENIRKKLKFFLLFFIKRIVNKLQKQEIEDPKVKEIINSINNKSYYKYPNFFRSEQVDKIKLILKEAEQNSDAKGESVNKDLTIKKKRVGNISQINEEEINSYTKNQIILDVAKYFHGLKVDEIEKTTYEIKEPGNNPETSELKKRKDDTIFYHFDRPYRVLKTFLILEDINDKDGPFQIVSGSHKIFYKSFLKKLLRYFGKVFLFRHHYLLEKNAEKYFINEKDVVYCKGKKGDLYFVNTEAWHCGGPLQNGGKREVLWNYIYQDSLSKWIRHIFTGKFLKI